MRPIGVVEKVTNSRNFLVRYGGPVEYDPKDLKVVDEELRVVGVVRDVIGPVDAPFFLVKVTIPIDEARSYVGRRLYLLEPPSLLARKLRNSG